ncbi:MAG: TetR/AcrR family transcriptional regulator [Anaerolineales bacterium]
MANDQKLLDCALALFSERGYDAVGVNDIVQCADVTKPTLYHYFNSKRGLLDALIQREAGPLLGKLLRATFYHRDLVMTLENIIRALFEIAIEHACFYRLQLGMHFSPPESEANQVIQPFAMQQREMIESVFLQAVADHGNIRGRQTQYAESFLGVANALIGLYLNQEIVLDEVLVYQTVHQFMYGIFS